MTSSEPMPTSEYDYLHKILNNPSTLGEIDPDAARTLISKTIEILGASEDQQIVLDTCLTLAMLKTKQSEYDSETTLEIKNDNDLRRKTPINTVSVRSFNMMNASASLNGPIEMLKYEQRKLLLNPQTAKNTALLIQAINDVMESENSPSEIKLHSYFFLVSDRIERLRMDKALKS